MSLVTWLIRDADAFPQLIVRIQRADGLRVADMLGLSDPYVKATVEEGGEVVVMMETSVRWQTCVLICILHVCVCVGVYICLLVYVETSVRWQTCVLICILHVCVYECIYACLCMWIHARTQ